MLFIDDNVWCLLVRYKPTVQNIDYVMIIISFNNTAIHLNYKKYLLLVEEVFKQTFPENTIVHVHKSYQTARVDLDSLGLG